MRRLSKLTLITIFLATGFWLLVAFSYAEVPHLINYQGKLTDKDDQPLEGSYPITFRIYDALSGGSPLWEETQSVVIEKGIFSVKLGSASDLNLSFDRPYFLEIKVGDDVMSPRQRITSVGYAFRAETAERVETDYIIDAKGGLIIENRTSDPSNPVPGQIWFRTDL